MFFLFVSSMLSVVIFFAPLPHLFYWILLRFFRCCIHKQVKHMNVFCLWDLFGHDVNLYYFLYNFSNNESTLFANKSVGKNVFYLSWGMYVWSFIWWWWWEKIFFLLFSNSIIECFCKIFCMKIVCYYYCIIFVYQQQ